MFSLRSVLAILLLSSLPLRAADWPAIFEQYEKVALLDPNADEPLYQLRTYARESGRLAELKSRWETLATGADDWRYRLLLAQCAVLAVDVPAARVELQKTTELAPGNAETWLALGKFEMWQGTPEAQPALEKARALASNPSRAIVMMVEDHLNRGRKTEALELLAKHWSEVRDSALMTRLLESWGRTAFTEGCFAEAVALLEDKQGPDAAGALAGLYAAIADHSMAAAVMSKARATWPGNVRLRERALAVARAAGDGSEALRLVAEAGRANDTALVWGEFLIELIRNGRADEAGRLLEARPEELASQAARWRAVLPEAVQLRLGPRVDAALASAPELWEAVFTRGELALIEARYPEAREILWSLFEPRFERQPFSSQAPDRFHRFPGYYISNVATHLTPGDRFSHVAYAYYALSELFRQPERRIDSPVDVMISPQDARDFALCLLELIALETKSEPAFQAELAGRVAQWTADDRLFAGLVAGAAPAMVAAIEAYAAGTQRMPSTDRVCIAQLKKVEASAQTEPSAIPKTRALLARLAATAPKPLPMKLAPSRAPPAPALASRPRKPEPYREPYEEFVKGRFAQTLDLYHSLLRETGDGGEEVTAYAMDYALTIGQHRGSPGKLAEAGATAFACLLPPTHKAPKLARPFDSADLWPPTHPASSWSTVYSRSGVSPERVESLPKEVQPKLVYPPKSLLGWAETGVLWAIFGETREPAVWGELKQRLDAPMDAAPPAQAFHWQIARSYLAWWNGEYDDAIRRMRELLTETADDGVRLGLAVMLQREGDASGATELLKEMKLPYPAFARVRDSWRLRMAAEAKDAATVHFLLEDVGDLPLEPESRRELVNALTTAGFGDQVSRMTWQRLTALLKEQDSRRIAGELREVGGSKNVRSIVLALRVLKTSPRLARTEVLSDRYRRPAADVLRATGLVDLYVADLEKDAAGDPVERQWRIAEVLSGEAATAAWRRLLELDPENVVAAERLMNQTESRDPDRWRVFDAMLAGNAEWLMQVRVGEIAPAYIAAGQLPKLLEGLANTRFYGPVARRGEADDQWRRLATALALAGEHDAAIAVLRKAVSLTDASAGALQRLLVLELDRAGRKEELGRELLTMLAPDAAPSATPVHLLETRSGRAEVGPPGRADILDPAAVTLARKAGVADEVRARLQKAAADSPAASRRLLLLRALEHDAAALPELETLAGGALRREEQPWLTALAEALSTWPKAAAACRQLVAKLEPLLPKRDRERDDERVDLARLAFRCDARPLGLKLARAAKETAVAESLHSPNILPLRRVVEVAREAGDASLLTECADAYVTYCESLPEGRMDGHEEMLRVLSIYLDRADTASAEKIIAAMRKRAGAKPNGTAYEESLERYVDELQARAGKLTGHVPMVWLDGERTTEKAATLVWDLALHRRETRPGRFSTTDGEVPGLAGKYDVELFFGESPDALFPLAQFPKAPVRGEWKGALPASFGFVQATFTRAGEVLAGPILPIAAGRNLLRTDAAEGHRFGPGVPPPARGGPSPGGSAISYRDQNSAYSGGGGIAARRVAIEPGHDYALAGWLRGIGEHILQLTWRYLDKDGRVLGSGKAHDFEMRSRYWSYHWLRLSWVPDAERTHGLAQIPEGTAFIEPSIYGGADGFDLAGFYLIEIPETRVR
jgi:hypothetical protein